MARIFGTVLILAGCAGFLYKWAEGEKARQRMAGEWIRLFVRWGYALEQEHVRLCDFLSFYETADAYMQAFLDEVCVCMRNHQNPKRTQNLAGLSAEAQKRTADRAGGLGNPYVCRRSILWRKQCRESAMQ